MKHRHHCFLFYSTFLLSYFYYNISPSIYLSLSFFLSLTPFFPLLLFSSILSYTQTIHPIPSSSSAPLRGEDSISMKEDRPKRKPSRKDSIEKMSMKDKLKLKIEKSERNLSVCASNVNDISRGADSDKGGGSYRGTSFSKRKHCQDSRVERSGSQRKSFEHAEPVSLILPASPRRSPSFAFQAWTKCTPRPSPATVQYKQNANQSLEFYVDRATGLPENCTVSRYVLYVAAFLNVHVFSLIYSVIREKLLLTYFHIS